MTETERLENIVAYYAAAVPSAILSAGLEDFTDYIESTPSDITKRQFCVYLGEGQYDINTDTFTFTINALLPGELRLDKYLSVIRPLVHAMSPELIGMTSLDRESYIMIYPGEEFGESSRILFDITYIRSLDDAYQEEIDS